MPSKAAAGKNYASWNAGKTFVTWILDGVNNVRPLHANCTPCDGQRIKAIQLKDAWSATEKWHTLLPGTAALVNGEHEAPYVALLHEFYWQQNGDDSQHTASDSGAAAVTDSAADADVSQQRASGNGNDDSSLASNYVIMAKITWLYRPKDLKEQKATRCKFKHAKHNELWYSNHKDDIQAGLILQPAQVLFLRRLTTEKDIPKRIVRGLNGELYETALPGYISRHYVDYETSPYQGFENCVEVEEPYMTEVRRLRKVTDQILQRVKDHNAALSNGAKLDSIKSKSSTAILSGATSEVCAQQPHSNGTAVNGSPSSKRAKHGNGDRENARDNINAVSANSGDTTQHIAKSQQANNVTYAKAHKTADSSAAQADDNQLHTASVATSDRAVLGIETNGAALPVTATAAVPRDDAAWRSSSAQHADADVHVNERASQRSAGNANDLVDDHAVAARDIPQLPLDLLAELPEDPTDALQYLMNPALAAVTTDSLQIDTAVQPLQQQQRAGVVQTCIAPVVAASCSPLVAMLDTAVSSADAPVAAYDADASAGARINMPSIGDNAARSFELVSDAIDASRFAPRQTAAANAKRQLNVAVTDGAVPALRSLNSMLEEYDQSEAQGSMQPPSAQSVTNAATLRTTLPSATTPAAPDWNAASLSPTACLVTHHPHVGINDNASSVHKDGARAAAGVSRLDTAERFGDALTLWPDAFSGDIGSMQLVPDGELQAAAAINDDNGFESDLSDIELE